MIRASAAIGGHAILLAALTGCAASGPRGSRPNARGETPVAVQLHVHGHSHHNSPAKPGSMSWHSDFAKSSGYDVIWWSDHTNLLDQRNALDVPLAAGALDSDSLGIRLGPEGRRRIAYLAPRVTGGEAAARLENGTVRLALTAPRASAWESFTYAPRESKARGRRVRGFSLARPVWSQAVLGMRVDLDEAGPDACGLVIVPLSWHRIRGRSVPQSLEFRLHPGPGEPRVRIDAPKTVAVDLFLGGRTHLEIPISDYASLLPEGDDNTITDLMFGVEARRGATARAAFGGIRLWSRETSPDSIWAHLETLASRNGRAFRLTEYLGGESNRTSLHMNAFLPDSEDVFPTLWPIPPREGFADSLVARVHAAGGLVSFNHMFGVNSRPASGDSTERALRASALAESLLSVRLYGADLIEVGYVHRGGADLSDHLWVWDYLTAHGLALPGTGVTDSHGNEYGPSMPNPFLTWVWCRSRSRRDLIDGLRRGRATFGDPFQFSGSLDFAVDGVPMGGRGACARDSATLTVELRGAPRGAEARLVQGLIESGDRPEGVPSSGASAGPGDGTIQYVVSGLPIDPSKPISLDTRRSSFVRIEVWKDTAPVVFSNTVLLLKP